MLGTLKNYQTSYLRMYDHAYKCYLHKEIDFSQKLIGVIGARGSGKTILLLQYLKENPLFK